MSEKTFSLVYWDTLKSSSVIKTANIKNSKKSGLVAKRDRKNFTLKIILQDDDEKFLENCTVDEGGNLISKGDDLKSENDKPGKRIKKKGKKDVVKSPIDAAIVDKISIFDDVMTNTIANDENKVQEYADQNVSLGETQNFFDNNLPENKGLPQKLISKKRHAAAIDDKLELNEKTRDSKQSMKEKFLSEDSDDSLIDPKDKNRSSVDGSVQKSKTKKRHAAVVDGELAISGMTHESKKSKKKKKESVSDDQDDLFVDSGNKSGSSNHVDSHKQKSKKHHATVVDDKSEISMDTRKLEKSKKKKSVLEDQDQDSSIGSSDMSGSSNSDKNLYQEFMMYLEKKRLKEKRRTEKNSKAEKRPKEVELIKGSKIMINRFKLDLYTQSNRKNPREMARKILKLIFSEDDLAKMTITGKKGRKQMPEDTYENV
ncbi:uncharacterized protein LOC141537312 isoform X1 [Cotesia typhae]|uniref:uncharacterized protein LOC141537312 isoform X1 n=1 Tax=Cotesia typhae TaxID=2053667 RepID=UPI003D69401D